MIEGNELILKEECDYRKTAFGIFKAGRPYVEYIRQSPDGGYAVIESDGIHIVKRVRISEEEFKVRREFGMLIEAGIMSSPSDADGRANMDEVYEAVRDWLKGVIVLESDANYSAVAAYAVMTWFPFRYDSLPYLRLIGDYGSGKTTALRALGQICYRALNLSAMFTPAALFRIVDNSQGTLMIDEADLKGSGIESHIVKILNHGYTRGIALIRLNNYGNPEYFQVFGPKVIATRVEFRDPALASRCLDIRMKQANRQAMDDMDKMDDMDVKRRAEAIRNGLLYWRMRSAECGMRNKGREAGESIYPAGSAQTSNWYEPRVSQLAKPIFDCTPKWRQDEVAKFFEIVNIGYQEARRNGPEEQVRRIIRKELKNMNHRLTLAQLYGQLSYKCRTENSSKKIARIAETLGAEKKHTRDGVVLWFRDGI